MKYKVFIGSSAEHLDYAESVQLNLSHLDFLDVICWNQGIFEIGSFTIDDLLKQLKTMTFGIFILAPDDFVKIRNEKFYCVRDNVMFEMGMFFGALGRERTYFIAPKAKVGNFKYRIPTDLEGLSYAEYDSLKETDNINSLLGPACTEIKQKITSEVKKHKSLNRIDKFGLFNEFDNLYYILFENCQELSTSFVHSRRWRETHLEAIDKFLQRKGTKWNIFLPNIKNDLLINQLREHFSDGQTIIPKIIDVYIFARNLIEKYASKVIVYFYDLYPTYSFYRFDDTFIISLYPLSLLHSPTPTMMLNISEKNNIFFKNDYEEFLKSSKLVSQYEIQSIIDSYDF